MIPPALAAWARAALAGGPVDLDGLYGPQSPDLVKHYGHHVHALPLGRPWGHGDSIALNIARHPGWQLAPGLPWAGDVLSLENPPYGHAGVCMADVDAGDPRVLMLAQDGLGGAPELTWWPVARVIGAARPLAWPV